MKYQEDMIYHLYNQSNNYELLFQEQENYLYFLRKIRDHLLPVADVLCYCLMPDHFHFLLKPTALGCSPSSSRKYATVGRQEDNSFQQQLSHELKTILSSYTKAFNRRYGRRGSLFRPGTKAKPAYQAFMPDGLGLGDLLPTDYQYYVRTCFHYIHDNPLKAGLVNSAPDWQYSSASDFAGIRNGTLCNYDLVEEVLGIKKP